MAQDIFDQITNVQLRGQGQIGQGQGDVFDTIAPNDTPPSDTPQANKDIFDLVQPDTSKSTVASSAASPAVAGQSLYERVRDVLGFGPKTQPSVLVPQAQASTAQTEYEAIAQELKARDLKDFSNVSLDNIPQAQNTAPPDLSEIRPGIPARPGEEGKTRQPNDPAYITPTEHAAIQQELSRQRRGQEANWIPEGSPEYQAASREALGQNQPQLRPDPTTYSEAYKEGGLTGVAVMPNKVTAAATAAGIPDLPPATNIGGKIVKAALQFPGQAADFFTSPDGIEIAVATALTGGPGALVASLGFTADAAGKFYDSVKAGDVEGAVSNAIVALSIGAGHAAADMRTVSKAKVEALKSETQASGAPAPNENVQPEPAPNGQLDAAVEAIINRDSANRTYRGPFQFPDTQRREALAPAGDAPQSGYVQTEPSEAARNREAGRPTFAPNEVPQLDLAESQDSGAPSSDAIQSNLARSISSASENAQALPETSNTPQISYEEGARQGFAPAAIDIFNRRAEYEAHRRQRLAAEAPHETDVTSTQNAVTDAERAARGISPADQEAARDFGTVWDDSATIEQSDPYAGARLVRELNKKARPVSDTENAVLLREQIKAQGEYDAAVKAVNEAPNDIARAEAQARLSETRDRVQAVYDADKKAGRESARGLNARKMLADDRYQLTRMEAERRAAQGGKPLNPKQLQETHALYKQIAELKAKFDTSEKVRVQSGLDAQFKKLLADTQKEARVQARKGGKVQDFLDRQEAKALDRIKGRRGRLSAGYDPTAIVDEAIVGAAHIGRGLTKFADWSARMLADFGERIKPHLINLWEMAQRIHAANSKTFADRSEANLKRYKTSLVNRTQDIQAKLEAGDLTKAVRNKTKLDREAFLLRADYQKAKDAFDNAVYRDQQARRPFMRKAADTSAKVYRAELLSNPVTLAKLNAAAVTRMVLTPLERATESVLGQLPILRKVHQAAPESGLNLRAEFKAHTTGIATGIRNVPSILRGDRTPEEAVFGKRHYPKGSKFEQALDMPGRSHAVIKSIPKESERARATEQWTHWMKERGYDVSDPQVQHEIGVQAEYAAKRAIFMQDNAYADWLGDLRRRGERPGSSAGAYAATKAAQFLQPIVKVPTNIAVEAFHYGPGGLASGAVKLTQAMRKGLANIKPEEANIVMHTLSKGMVGSALWLTAYYYSQHFGGFYQKHQYMDSQGLKHDEIKFMGITIPDYLLHAPAFIAMQTAATIAKVQNKVVKGQKQGLGAGLGAGAVGLLENLPLVNEISRLDGLLGTEAEKRKALGNFASGFVPAIVRKTAEWTDPIKEPYYRAPKTLGDYVKRSIPGLREQVPVKKGKDLHEEMIRRGY